MIDIEIKRAENVFVLKPEGSISAGDFRSVATTIDEYINDHDAVPRLVFQLGQLPLWQDLDAMAAHFHLVRDHHKVIPRVAVVTDNALLALLRPVIDVFTGAKVRRFPSDALDDAINWAAMEKDHPGSFIVMEELPSDVIGIDTRGLISATDYRDTLEPLVADKLKQHDKLKMLLVAGPYFDGFSAGALWDDTRFGFAHFTTFSKLALVTDHDWLRHAASLFGALMPTEVRVFPMEKLEDARQWIKT